MVKLGAADHGEKKPSTNKYLASSEMSIALILSVCPTSFAIRFPDLGSHILITRSGEPDAITLPYGSVVSA